MIKKIIAFDFDNTLTRFNLSSDAISLQSSIPDMGMIASVLEKKYGLDGIFCDLINNKFFTSYMNQLKSEGILFVIVTYGFKNLIEILLTKAGVLHLFSRIYTPLNFGLKEGYDWFNKLHGKNAMLELVKKDFNFNSNKNIILIDDSARNICKAQEAGYSTLYVVNYAGLVMENVDAINKFVQN